MCWPTPLLSPVLFLVRQLPGYLAGDWWVESRSLSYILAHRFSVRDESHRLSRSFILGGHPKRHINQISKRTKPILFIYCLFNVITIPNQGLSPFLSLPHSPASPSQVSPSKVPSCVLYSEPLKDLFDIEEGEIISCPLKK